MLQFFFDQVKNYYRVTTVYLNKNYLVVVKRNGAVQYLYWDSWRRSCNPAARRSDLEDGIGLTGL